MGRTHIYITFVKLNEYMTQCRRGRRRLIKSLLDEDDVAYHFVKIKGEAGGNELKCGVRRLRAPEMVAVF